MSTFMTLNNFSVSQKLVFTEIKNYKIVFEKYIKQFSVRETLSKNNSETKKKGLKVINNLL